MSELIRISTNWVIELVPLRDGQMYIPVDGDRIVSRANWQALAAGIEAFYAHTADELIDTCNANAVSDRDATTHAGSAKAKQRTRQSIAGCVYILCADNGLYKIGKTKMGTNRAQRLEIIVPMDIGHIHSIETPDISGLEAALHQKYADKHVKGEWFRLDPVDVDYLLALERVEDCTNV